MVTQSASISDDIKTAITSINGDVPFTIDSNNYIRFTDTRFCKLCNRQHSSNGARLKLDGSHSIIYICLADKRRTQELTLASGVQTKLNTNEQGQTEHQELTPGSNVRSCSRTRLNTNEQGRTGHQEESIPSDNNQTIIKQCLSEPNQSWS